MNYTPQAIIKYLGMLDAALYQGQQTEGAKNPYIGALSLPVIPRTQEGVSACLAESIRMQRCPAP